VSDMPKPKYSVGDTFYVASVQHITAEHPCPDCLGSREWKVTTPAGHELTTPCVRCSSGYSSNDLPPLKYQAWEGKAELRTVGAIEVKWPHNASWDKHPVRYMAGPGGGWVVTENDTFDTSEQAEGAAKLRAAEENAKIAGQPQALEKRRVGVLQYPDARYDQFKNGMWDSWYAYREIREVIDDILDKKNEHLTTREIRESLEDATRSEWRARNLPALVALVAEAERQAADPDSPFAPLVAALPAAQRAALAKASPAEGGE
jgi:hypothetical protein